MSFPNFLLNFKCKIDIMIAITANISYIAKDEDRSSERLKSSADFLFIFISNFYH